MGYDTRTLPRLASREFRTIARPTGRHLYSYVALVLASQLSIAGKSTVIISLVLDYLFRRPH